MAILYHIANSWTKTAYTLFSKWEIEGREAVPPKGPLLIISNHQGNADPPLIAASIPRRVYFFGKGGLFYGPIASAILRACGVYPLSRDGQDVAAALWGLHTLRQDKALSIFPENTRSLGGMRRALPGVAYLALKTQTPILPVGITGTEKIPGLWRVAFPFCRVKVKIGEPFSLPVVEGNIPRDQLQAFADMLMERVAQLLPPEYRGLYGPEQDFRRAEPPRRAEER